MKASRVSLTLLGSLLFIHPARLPAQGQEIGHLQWKKVKPTRPSVLPPAITDSTPSFYKKKAEGKKIIDEYWGPGVPVQEKRAIFNRYADHIQRYFTAFEGLGISWDSLRSHYCSQMTIQRAREGSSVCLQSLSCSVMNSWWVVKEMALR